MNLSIAKIVRLRMNERKKRVTVTYVVTVVELSSIKGALHVELVMLQRIIQMHLPPGWKIPVRGVILQIVKIAPHTKDTLNI